MEQIHVPSLPGDCRFSRDSLWGRLPACLDWKKRSVCESTMQAGSLPHDKTDCLPGSGSGNRCGSTLSHRRRIDVRLRGWSLCPLLACMLLATTAFAQPPSAGSREPDEQPPRELKPLDIEILIQSQPVYRVKAQEWGRAFQEIGRSPRFREPKAGDAPVVEDVDRGGRVTVHVVGGMAVDGAIHILDQKFTIADLKPLAALLDELALYGAAGPPRTNPKWGLTDDQFLEVTTLLMEPVTAPVTLQSPVVTVESLSLPEGLRIKFSDAALQSALARKPEASPETMDLTGISKGTAMAIVLAQYGLGFRPLHSGLHRYDIEIDSGDESSNLWPAGWKTQESAAVVLPAWLKSIPFELEEVEISALAAAVAAKLEIPVFQSSHALAAEGRDLNVLTYSRKKDRVSPSRLLMAVGDKLQLGFDLRVDEAGQLFLWATTRTQSLAFKQRFAHVKQTKSP